MNQGGTFAPSESGAEINERRPAGRRRWTAALVLLCVASLWIRFRTIDAALPYPWDIDEGFVSGPALRIVQTGTWHPYTFNYPSLPKYLAAAGMSAGFIRGASRLEVREVGQIGNVGYPYYETPRVMQTARQLFACLSVVMIAATGIAAWYAFEVPLLIFLVPLVLSTSELFFYHSWMYLNVDIVGACFTTLALAAILRGSRSPSIAQSAILPGVFTGLAAGGKYTMAVVIVPVLVGIMFSVPAGRRVRGSVAAVVSMVAAFLLVTPYSLLDIPGFLNGVASEAYHYARGHSGADGPPGIAQLIFYRDHFRAEFGLAGLGVVAAGAVAFAVADWRRASILWSFPIAVLALLLPQRAHFTRNTLGLYPVVAMFLAYGVLRLHAWIMTLVMRRSWIALRNRRRAGAIVGLLLLISAVPLWHLRDQWRDHTDSRKVALAWMVEHVPPDWAVIVPTQLGFDARALKARGSRVVDVDLQAASNVDAFQRLLGETPGPAVMLLPSWGADTRFEGQATADALNALGRLLKPARSFGTNPVLVNYTQPVPWGNPQFGVVALGGALGGALIQP